METYYKAMPEQFYSGSNLPVVTPSNVKAWIEQMLADSHTADVAEVFSGSSALTYGCCTSKAASEGAVAHKAAEGESSWDLQPRSTFLAQ